ncbi:MAG: diadenylate cyclase [Victivallaceae bacterium]|nr:diadenylate cyclase [Victivallaceae bacterium]
MLLLLEIVLRIVVVAIVFAALTLTRGSKPIFVAVIMACALLLLRIFIAPYSDSLTGLLDEYGILLFIGIFVIFQQDIRRACLSIKSLFTKASKGEWKNAVDEVCLATRKLRESKTGALIVFQLRSDLSDLIQRAISMVEEVSAQTIIRMFDTSSVFHDGAIIIKGARIVSARVYLPNADGSSLTDHLGTRHLAALGISEHSDAITICVSEEKETISVTWNGRFYRDLEIGALRKLLEGVFVNHQDDPDEIADLFNHLKDDGSNCVDNERPPRIGFLASCKTICRKYGINFVVSLLLMFLLFGANNVKSCREHMLPCEVKVRDLPSGLMLKKGQVPKIILRVYTRHSENLPEKLAVNGWLVPAGVGKYRARVDTKAIRNELGAAKVIEEIAPPIELAHIESRRIKVEGRISGMNEDYEAHLEFEPAEVQVSGFPEIVNDIRAIDFGIVDISGMRESFEMRKEIKVDGADVKPNNVLAKCTIIGVKSTKAFPLLPVKIMSTQDMECTTSDGNIETIDVDLEGKRMVLDHIKRNDVKVYVDVTDVTKDGTYIRPIKCHLDFTEPAKVNYDQTRMVAVKVTMKKKNK